MTTAPLASIEWTVRFVLQTTSGSIVSITVTVKLQLLDRPPVFVAVQTTLLTPKRKPLSDGGVHVTVKGVPPSLALVTKLTGVSPPMHSTTMFVEQVIVGGV